MAGPPLTTPGPLLDRAARDLLSEARRAVLATLAPDGLPRLVPVCYAVDEASDPTRPVLHVPLDEKPKRTSDPLALARVRDILDRPRVALLVDRWDEDWGRLAWLRLGGLADILPGDGSPEHVRAVTSLRARYPQYRAQAIEARPMLRIRLDRASGWWATHADR